ncbi:hypothetical protein BV20DRAFT_336892 [Pilatotrama ljubarskyi]|nr:hypothetical protein BV20DRAFT_336892 [Pilatotrama ljubarskyi]
MSFNARLPSNSSASHRGRPYGNRRRPARGGLVKSEDAQPNELLNKRNVSGPPVIRTSGPLPRDRGRGAPAFSGGRGHIPQPTGSNAPYANSRLNGYRGNRGNSSQMRARPYPYHADSTEPWSRLSHGPNLNVPPPSGSHASSGTPQQFGYSGYAALPRAERWTAPESSTDEHGPHAASEDSRDSARISQHRVDDQSGSNFSSQGTLWRPRPPATVSSRTLPPLPRSQFHPFSRREAPPHMGGAGSSSIATTAPWMHDPATHFMPGEPSSVDASRGIHITGTTSHVAAPAGYIQAPTELNGIAQAPASALASLLPDRAQSWPSSTSTMTSRSNPPPLKRRKLSPINATSTLSSPRPEMPPLPTLTNTASTSIIPEPQRTVNPQPTEITSASPTVKRERSPSPTIDDASARLVAEGCVRVAPLPPECKATRPGYKAARQAWTAKEVKKLRDLGLQPTRVFVRANTVRTGW